MSRNVGKYCVLSPVVQGSRSIVWVGNKLKQLANGENEAFFIICNHYLSTTPPSCPFLLCLFCKGLMSWFSHCFQTKTFFTFANRLSKGRSADTNSTSLTVNFAKVSRFSYVLFFSYRMFVFQKRKKLK